MAGKQKLWHSGSDASEGLRPGKAMANPVFRQSCGWLGNNSCIDIKAALLNSAEIKTYIGLSLWFSSICRLLCC